MDALALDPTDYDGTYKLVGGRVALDFVNTVSWPLTERRHDWLGTTSNVTAWLDAVGLADADDRVEIIDADLVPIHRLRAIIREAVSPLARGVVPTPDAIDALNASLIGDLATRRISPATLSWAWSPATSTLDLLRPVLSDAAEIITGDRHDRLRHCPSCDWIFEDQTRNGKRRWCDMADCGSRAKSREYYHRTRSAR